jgi:hypothetical protein
MPDLHSLTDDDRDRLAKIKVELDQCWDLLRQRRALREFGRDPDQAKVRPPKIVEATSSSPGPQVRRQTEGLFATRTANDLSRRPVTSLNQKRSPQLPRRNVWVLHRPS